MNSYNEAILCASVCVVVLFAFPGAAQVRENLFGREPAHVVFGEQQGAGLSRVYSIFPDSRGRVWLGTSEGPAWMVEHEPVYLYEREPPPYERSKLVFDIEEDEAGHIWFSDMKNRLFYYDEQRFQPYPFQDTIFRYQPEALFLDGFKVSEGSAFLSYRGKSLKRIMPDGQWVDLDTTCRESMLNVCVVQLETGVIGSSRACYPKDGNREVNGVRFTIHDTDGQVREIALDMPVEHPLRFRVHACSHGDSLYLGVDNFVFVITDTSVVDVLRLNSHVYGLAFDKRNRLLISAENGLTLYDRPSLRPLAHWFEDEFINLKHHVTDFEGGTWLSSLGTGVVYIPDMRITHYPNDFVKGQKMPGLTADREGNVYFCLSSEKLLRITPQGDTIHLLYSKRGKNAHLVPNLLYSHVHRQLFFWRNSFISVLNASATETDEHIHFQNCIRLSEGPDGSVWALSTDRLMQVRPSTSLKPAPPKRLRFMDVAVQSSKRAWVATREGLYLFDQSIGWKQITVGGNAFSNGVRDLELLDDSTLMVSTCNEALLLFNVNTLDSIASLSDADACLRIHRVDSSFLLFQDDRGRFSRWLDHEEKRMHQFPRHFGLPTTEMGASATVGDRFWISIQDGLLAFEKGFFLDTSITQTRLFMEAVSIANSLIRHSGPLELAHHENHLHFKYYGLSYKATESLNYRHRLLGLDSRWTETENTEVQYTSLVPGAYRFEVQVQNRDGTWSHHRHGVQFDISPPFWATWWFRAVLVLVLGGCIYSLFRWQLSRVKAAHDLRNQVLRFQQHSLAAQVNPHFIFNAINSIQWFVLRNKQEQAYHYLEQFGSLIRHVLYQSGEESISLEEEIQILTHYLELEVLRQPGRFTYEFCIDPLVHCDDVRIPPMMLQPYIENAIWHGFNGIGHTGKLTIAFREANDILECVIEDNGIGRKHAAELDGRKGHRSKGTQNVAMRLNLLSGLYKSAFTQHFIDLEDNHGNACGTRVMLNIPLTKNA